MSFAPRDFLQLAPEIALATLGLLVLLVDVFGLRRSASDRRRALLGRLTLAGIGSTFVLLALDLPTTLGYGPDDADPILFFGALAGDGLTARLNPLILMLLAGVVGLSMASTRTSHWGEYYALLCWSAVGMMLLIAAEELLMLFLALELMTICLYLVASFDAGRRQSAEAGLKYFVYGSAASALFLFGLSLLYGITGVTRIGALGAEIGDVGRLTGDLAAMTALVLVLVGLGFKLAIVPFHQWSPDTLDGSPTAVSAWVATGSKVAGVVALMKLLVHGLSPWRHDGASVAAPGWAGLIAVLAAITMTIGNLAALRQRSLKRLLAYSSIAQAGTILVGIVAAGTSVDRDAAAGATLYYVVIYALATLGAFAIAAWLDRDLGRAEVDDLGGLGRRYPGMGLGLIVVVATLIGLPPTGGFFGKLSMFAALIDSKIAGRPLLVGLVAVALLNSVISAFYYLRLVHAAYFRPVAADRPAPPPPPPGVSWSIVLTAGLVLLTGVVPSPFLEATRGAAIPMLSDSGRLAPLARIRTEFDPTPRPPRPIPTPADLPARAGL